MIDRVKVHSHRIASFKILALDDSPELVPSGILIQIQLNMRYGYC